MAHFPAFRQLIDDMLKKNSDREHFRVVYAEIRFDVIISLDVHPYEILIGGQGINWACTMSCLKAGKCAIFTSLIINSKLIMLSKERKIS